MLTEVIVASAGLCEAEKGRLWLFKNGLLHVAANFGASHGLEYDKEHPHPPDRTSMAGRAALAREVVHVPDVDADPDYTYAGPRPYRSASTSRSCSTRSSSAS